MVETNSEDIISIPYEVITDKALNTQDYLFKLIIIGDTGVGKSCLMKRVMDNEFRIEHQVTIGVEFGSFGVKIDNKIVKLQIWDTAGQESFRSVTRIFYRGAHCVFLTYDVTRSDTFTNLIQWLGEIKEHASPDVRIYLIGNKSELEEKREILFERAAEFAKAHNLHKLFETSAKTGFNVEEVFSCIAKELYFKTKEEEQRIQEQKRRLQEQQQRQEQMNEQRGRASRQERSISLQQPQIKQKEGKKKQGGCKC